MSIRQGVPPRVGWAMAAVAGVEDVVGFAPAGRQVGAVAWMRFWAPGSPPQAMAGADSTPVVPGGGRVPGAMAWRVRGGL